MCPSRIQTSLVHIINDMPLMLFEKLLLMLRLFRTLAFAALCSLFWLVDEDLGALRLGELIPNLGHSFALIMVVLGHPGLQSCPGYCFWFPAL